VAQLVHIVTGGTEWRSWLKHSARLCKVVASFPDGITGTFH